MYFALGVFSIIALIFVVVVIIGTKKVFKLEKRFTEFQNYHQNDLDRNYRNFDDFRQNIYRDMDDRFNHLYRNLDDRFKECKKYKDKKNEKNLN